MNDGIDILIVVCALAVAIFLFFLFALLRDMSRVSKLSTDSPEGNYRELGASTYNNAATQRGGDRQRSW